jgi:hypothetical protein
MKKRPVFLGVLLAFGLAFAGCPTDGNGGGNNDGAAFLGNTLELSGQVYLMEENDDYTISYRQFNGNLWIFNYYDYGGSGEIRDGTLAYSIGTPNELQAFYDYDGNYNGGWGGLFDNDYDNVLVSNAIVRGIVLPNFEVNYKQGADIQKLNMTASVRGNSYSGTIEGVYYVYVENDVTVSGKGKSKTYTNTEEGGTYTQTYTTKNFNLALKAGWNAVHFKHVYSTTFTGTIDNPTSRNSTETITISLGNPSLRWVLWEYDYGSPDSPEPPLSLP